MGIKIKVPKIKINKNSVLGHLVNPVAGLRATTGIKLPTTISIGGKSINVSPDISAQIKQAQSSLRDVKQAGRQAEVDWKNSSKGEVGKYVAKTGEGVYGVVMTLPRAIQSGNWERELQRGYGNSRMALSPIENMIGENKGWQDKLRNDKGWNAWTLGTAKNFAGQTHGHATMQSSGTISNADRVQWQQLSVKAAAVVAAIFGGAAVAGAYGGSGTAGAGAAGASGTAGGVGAGSAGLTMPALGSSAGYGTTASYGLGSTVVGTGSGAGASLVGGGAAASSGLGFWGTLGTGVGTQLVGGLVNRGTAAVGDATNNYIGDLLGNNPEQPSMPNYGGAPQMYADPTGNGGASYGGQTSEESAQTYLLLGAAALAGYLIYKRVV